MVKFVREKEQEYVTKRSIKDYQKLCVRCYDKCNTNFKVNDESRGRTHCKLKAHDGCVDKENSDSGNSQSADESDQPLIATHNSLRKSQVQKQNNDLDAGKV